MQLKILALSVALGITSLLPTTAAACDPGAAPFCWYQPIEWDASPTKTALSDGWGWTQFTCDQTDPDWDLVLVWSAYNYNQDPNSLRFWVDDWYMSQWYPWEMNGYGYNLNHVYLCIPTRVSGTFSVDSIRAHTFISLP